jgi:hypothetical protein
MGMVIHLGLSRFHQEPEQRIAMLQSLVGYSRSLLEVIGDRVIEVGPNSTRWLPKDEAMDIMEILASSYERFGTTYDAYSWDQLEDIGAFNVQDIALPLDGPKRPPGLDRVRIGNDTEVRLIDLKDSIGNWPEDSVAFGLHEIAMELRMVVHSA